MSDYSDSTYETSSYDTSYAPTYETTSYTPTYDTGYTYDTSSYDASGYAEAFDSAGYVEAGSYSYDATDWSSVAAVSEGYTDQYYVESGIADQYWDLSTQAYLEGDSYAAYELNQMSLDWAAQADGSWDTGNDVWTSMAETATTTTWEPAVDTSWSTSSYDTSWSAASTDTSWSASTDTSTDGW